MPHLDFDHKDVEAKGRKPWKQRAAFRAEIEPDDMGDLAAQYVRAAPGAHDAGDLAERATEMSAGAGELDGRSLIVSEERIDETARGLQGNGNGIDETVRLILESMHEANDALDAVNLVIDEPLIGLDATLRAHQRDAVTEWNEWVELRQDAVADRMAALRGNPGTLGPPTPLTLWRRGDHVTLSALPTLNGDLYTWSQLPDSLAERIRQRHIAAVAEAAEAADDRITREKDDYRAAMMHKALRLGEQDYDLDAGPFTLFTTPEMGDFAGARLHEELGRQNPDMLTVKLYTEGLAALLDGIVEEDGDPIPFAALDPDQRAYLTAALGSLTTEDLTVLGRFASVPGAGLPGTVALQDEVLERIANGLNVLTDPSLGGYSVSDDAGWRKLPPGVRDVLALAETDDPAFMFVDHLGEWNGFGALMSHADVPPSDAWAKRLARAAMDAQLMSMDQYLQSDVTTLQANTGSSDLLGMVALNSEASARLIKDDDFRADLLTAYWEDSVGVARFIDSGTTVPDGVSWNEPEARQYIDAAFHFMVDAAERHDVIVGDHDMLNTGRFDHRGLQWALGDTMLNYMDFISQMSEDNQLGAKDMKLFGFDYAYSFDMAGDTRRKLIEIMLHSGEGSWLNFAGGAAEWQTTRAAESFARTGGELTETANFENIGSIAGSIAHATGMDEVESERLQQMTAMRGIGSAFGITAMMVQPPAWGGALFNLSTWMAQDIVFRAMGDPNEHVVEAQWKLDNDGDIPLRVAVADAALRANFRGAGDEVDQLARDMMHEIAVYGWDDAEAAAKDIGGKYYAAYVTAMERGYDLATHNIVKAD
ncbi:hypothetical protein [Streptomyces sp. NPDC049879]|uniref:TPR repeat region-containing protein n=1 Tax=Streptomyces sp. NPDC049879 TaxID=3365598 RepID=UPI0037A4C882